jgi:hypothetical protein
MSELFGVYDLTFGTVTVITACMQGFLTAIVYFWKEKEAQKIIMIALGMSQAAIHDINSTIHSLTLRSEEESTLTRSRVQVNVPVPLPALLESGLSDNKMIAYESKDDSNPSEKDPTNTVVPFYELPVVTGEAVSTST